MLKNLKRLLFVIYFCSFYSGFSQTGFEVGILAGPVQLRSDFGLRGDGPTNSGNIGYGVGLMLDINPMDWGGGERLVENYIVDHFKLRFDVSYNKTQLRHYGQYVDSDSNSENTVKLRNQRGESKNINTGAFLEYYPLSNKKFYYHLMDFSPYAIFGFQYIYAQPGANTTNPRDLYSEWLPGSVNTGTFNALSIDTGVGLRYKVSDYSDFLIEAKVQFYTSDWVDGLNHQLSYNKNNDALIWINIGYVYYIN
ncbi:THC0290_0291 family protein [Formosa sp. 4Alg 33]|uniref:THC0290_0291 family protein n=1 Tax=Formosa sp. 4Alg 33 TaxID=3382189 RepID=UPI003D9C66B8